MKDLSKQSTRRMTLAALMAAVMCVLGPLSLPIGAVPISLTNLAVALAVWLLGPKWGAVSVAVYLALGAVGLPVFSGYAGGLAKLAGPTGGYLAGFVPMALIAGLVLERTGYHPFRGWLGLVLGTAVCYGFGTLWFMAQMGCTLGHALAVCVYPFILFDLVKMGVACVLGPVLRRRLTDAGLLAD